jgi:hypothetical protein
MQAIMDWGLLQAMVQRNEMASRGQRVLRAHTCAVLSSVLIPIYAGLIPSVVPVSTQRTSTSMFLLSCDVQECISILQVFFADALTLPHCCSAFLH